MAASIVNAATTGQSQPAASMANPSKAQASCVY